MSVQRPTPAHHTPTMPPAVAAAAARSEQLMREASGQQPQPDAPQPPQPAPAPQEPQPPQPQPQPEPQPETSPQGLLPGIPPAPEQPVTPPSNDLAKLQNDLQAALGRLRSANEVNAAQSQRLGELERMMATLQMTKPAAPAAPTAPPKYVTEEEEQNVGSDLLTIMGKRAQEIAEPIVASLKAEVESLKNQLGATTQHVMTNAAERTHAALDANIPDWRAQNRDEGFKAWLQMPDPISGIVRQELLTRAYTLHDTQRVLNIFLGYRSETGGDPQTDPSRLPQKVPLAALAAPGRATAAAPPPSPAAKRTYTSAQITQFYADKVAGKYRGREADVDATERDIFAAQREGRIVG